MRCSAGRPGHMTRRSAETMHANIEMSGWPTWTEADQTLASRAARNEGARNRPGDQESTAARRESIPDEEKRAAAPRYRRHRVETCRP